MTPKQVVIVGGGFAGLNAARSLAAEKRIAITLIDRHNHHLFQPLLYQVAMAGLSPADIASPIRSILSRQANARVICGTLTAVSTAENKIITTVGTFSFDYLILACGAMHSYFGNDQWEPFAPGLKTIEQATEIRRRVLQAFENAELTEDPRERRKQLTFVIVGGGPTGVELAGAIGEMSRFTLARDFRNVDPTQARILLVEAGPHILPTFSPRLSARAVRDLAALGVEVLTDSRVTRIDSDGVNAGDNRIAAATVLWAAGVQAVSVEHSAGFDCDDKGRIRVKEDLSLPQFDHIFVAGDQSCFPSSGGPLPGTAPVAVQQGKHFGQVIRADLNGRPRPKFRYRDKGQMATIGRSSAVAEIGRFRLSGRLAWWAWLVVHIYFLTGFRNRIFVILSWAWSFITFRRGARLIVDKDWRFFADSASKKVL